jgi:hypothetical protein
MNLRFDEPSVRACRGSNNVLLSKTWYNSAPPYIGTQILLLIASPKVADETVQYCRTKGPQFPVQRQIFGRKI